MFDFASVDEMPLSEEEDGQIAQQPTAGPSKQVNPMTVNVTSKRVHQNKGNIGKSTMAPRSKQSNTVMDTAKKVATAMDEHKGAEEDQKNPVVGGERKVMKTRAAWKGQDGGRKIRFAMDSVTDPHSTGKC